MNHREALAVIAALAILLHGGSPDPADAQQAQQCAPMANWTAGLAERYGEAPVFDGAMQGGARIVVFATTAGTTWTVLSVAPNGLACLRASGETWTVPAPIMPGVDG